MAIDTAETELAAVNTAIEHILTSAQEAKVGNSTLVMADLAELYRRKNTLEAKIARAARGGIRIRGATPV